MAEGLTTSDVLAMRNYDNDRYCDDGMFGGNGSWVFFLFFLLAWGGGGFGWGGNRGGEALTQAEMQRGFDTQAILSKLDGINSGICDGFYANNTTNLQGFHGVDNAICNLGYQTAQLANNINSNITEARFDAKSCCYSYMVA